MIIHRFAKVLLADALAIVREYGKATVFITMTCNPEWPEIAQHMKPGQTSADRPDVVAQVFKAKKAQLLEHVTRVLNGHSKIYTIYVIEFQKRGLPHVHIAIKFENESLTRYRSNR